MSGLLYAGQVLTFVLLAYCAYRAERPGAPKDGGLFGLKPPDEPGDPATEDTGQAGGRAASRWAGPAAKARWDRTGSPDR